MTTPTREQVIAMLHERGVKSSELMHTTGGMFDAIASIFTAGRDQGLREAKEVCEAERVTEPSSTGDDYAAYDEAITDCAAAIEQLRGK